jgi:hypothetical protein
VTRGVAGGQGCRRWPGVQPVARGVAGGQGCRWWTRVSQVARGVFDKPVARGVYLER